MRQVSVDTRDKDTRAEQFKVATTILDTSIGGAPCLTALSSRLATSWPAAASESRTGVGLVVTVIWLPCRVARATVLRRATSAGRSRDISKRNGSRSGAPGTGAAVRQSCQRSA